MVKQISRDELKEHLDRSDELINDELIKKLDKYQSFLSSSSY